MRDWLITGDKDRTCLKAALVYTETDGAWRPWHGAYDRARRLADKGLLKKAGSSAMPPYVNYVITDRGREELEVAAALVKEENK